MGYELGMTANVIADTTFATGTGATATQDGIFVVGVEDVAGSGVHRVVADNIASDEAGVGVVVMIKT